MLQEGQPESDPITAIAFSVSQIIITSWIVMEHINIIKALKIFTIKKV